MRLGRKNRKSPSSLSSEELVTFLKRWPADLVDIVLALRDVVRAAAPKATEAVKFQSLCYFKPDASFGSIGGNVCMISVRRGVVYLSFLHGAGLPDPQRLLTGTAKAKREIKIDTTAVIRHPAIRDLIRAASRCVPTDVILPH